MNNDKVMENLVTNWGLPKCLERDKEHIIFKFDDEGITGTSERGYHCNVRDVKFCLYNERTDKVVFSMDFFKGSPSLPGRHMSRIVLELLYVHDESLRRKGVASYYFNRLREYALEEKVKCIYVRADANANNFKNDDRLNALNQTELEMFYKIKSTLEMPVYVES
ncbi:hypothetical protein [Paenibacillus borealis]|uniref:N-acetyltransferase domain-containing protein n=1 Tax=Paenibacillus borealis TaxID=160799 RepID=A0A089LFM1_PAEBO|nr:hypothetical protein [Paenibacillus borealis]AIQ59677.1 hypothetical protein PBOR_24005 [Paenibacillus borealis]